MSVRNNVIWGGVSQVYIAIVSIVTLPFYLKFLGVEAYGLISFFLMFQMWFMLLDAGIGQTLSRQSALFRAGGIGSEAFGGVINHLKIVSLLLSGFGGGLVVLFSGQIAVHWLHVERLPLTAARLSVCLMALCMMLRVYSSVFRGVATGFERIAWLGIFNSVIASIRWGGALSFIYLFKQGIEGFFLFQVLVSVFENIVLSAYVRRLVPVGGGGVPDRSVLRFSFSLGVSSLLWLMLSQLDKLLLSGTLSLVDYGYFNIAVVVSSAVGYFSGPVGAAIMPRLSKLYSEGEGAGFFSLYNAATQLVSIVAFSCAAVCIFVGKDLIFVWTGNAGVAEEVAPIVGPYAVGNALLALVSFPYYMQFAHGNMRLHNWGNIVFVLILVPIIVFSSLRFGAVGSAYAWMFINAVFFLVWTPVVHHKFAPSTHWDWVLRNIFPVFLTSWAAAATLYYCFYRDRVSGLMDLILFGGVVFVAGSLGSRVVRGFIADYYDGYVKSNV